MYTPFYGGMTAIPPAYAVGDIMHFSFQVRPALPHGPIWLSTHLCPVCAPEGPLSGIHLCS